MLATTHIHTRHSWDGIIKPRELVEQLNRAGVQLALVTDHDSFDGSLEVAEIAAREAPELSVPVAAEIRTDLGDVVVILDESDTPPIENLRSWDTLVETVRGMNGLIWLPHPFRDHPDPERHGRSSRLLD